MRQREERQKEGNGDRKVVVDIVCHEKEKNIQSWGISYITRPYYKNGSVQVVFPAELSVYLYNERNQEGDKKECNKDGDRKSSFAGDIRAWG